ncbi:hypothetical protein BIY24_07685 [Halobacteriovorax marinus]|uniref:hypothetical protein n=1 Tax=Halobacteriovorax marinus TaxID=97084 RepID=UPI000BC3411C|nr:hypothetical protein [Halobacteriovorax marinus]ATH07833.1 hypothetical protein BIY24_07685 [Halobacteriovorax marinus]
MFKIIASIYSFFLLFYLMSYQFYSTAQREALLSFLILAAVIVIMVAPSFSAKDRREKMKDVKEREWKEGEYHNDFTRVGSAEDYTPVKPIDLAGDAALHAREQLDEDLNRLFPPEDLIDDQGEDIDSQKINDSKKITKDED